MKAVAVIFSLFYLYHFLFFMASLLLERDKKETPKGQGKSCFAVFFPAHNEENVIFESIYSVFSAHYPIAQFDVYVVADNCTDKTANIARLAAAKVLERTDQEKRGKQYALEWAFQQVDLSKYDAVLILDADNHVDPEIFRVLDYHLVQGHKVIQAYEETKNAADSWISMNNAYMYWYMFRLQMIRTRLGMSAWLAGTGVCISTEILQRIGWHIETLVDDVEFTCKVILSGENVHLASEAVVYDLKPVNLKDSWNQRIRWIRGQTQATFLYWPKLLKMTLKSYIKGHYKEAARAFDGVMWLPMQFIILFSFIYSLSTNGLLYFLNMIFSIPVLYVLPLIAERVRLRKAWTHLITTGFFWLTWIPITIWGIVTHKNKIWWRTPHQS